MVISCRGLLMIAGQMVWRKRFFGFDCRCASMLILRWFRSKQLARRQLPLALRFGNGELYFAVWGCLVPEFSRPHVLQSSAKCYRCPPEARGAWPGASVCDLSRSVGVNHQRFWVLRVRVVDRVRVFFRGRRAGDSSPHSFLWQERKAGVRRQPDRRCRKSRPIPTSEAPAVASEALKCV
jgi:hypothetical protein